MNYTWELPKESLTVEEYVFVHKDFKFRWQNHFSKRIKSIAVDKARIRIENLNSIQRIRT